MVILTVLSACLLGIISVTIVSGIEAFPVAGILYGVLTVLLGIVSFPFWTWYAITAGALFIFNLLFESYTEKK